VIKGNGYGFGRTRLAEIAAEFSDTVAVGTIHELDGLPESLTPVVLTPTLTAPGSSRPILTIGNDAHLAALEGWTGRVVVKLVSDLRRFGGPPTMIDRARAAGLDVVGVSVHPPIAGTDDDRVEQIERALVEVDPGVPAWLSHLGTEAYDSLPGPRRYRLRVGTALWHGDKSALRLGAVGFDAVKHLVLCRVEKRPPKLDLDLYPYLPRATVDRTSAASYMCLVSGDAA